MEIFRFIVVSVVLILGVYLIKNVFVGLKTGKLSHSDGSSITVRKKSPALFFGILAIQILIAILLFYTCTKAYLDKLGIH